MSKFAFLLHPLNIKDVAKKYKIADKINPKVIGSILKRKRPFLLSEITGIRSLTGATADGVFIVVPFLPWQFSELEDSYLIKKHMKAIAIADEAGAKIVGLGAFTALVGQNGKLLADLSDTAITTGNTYTVATAIEGTLKACELMGLSSANESLSVIGASGSIGSSCAELLAKHFKSVILVGRDLERLGEVKERVRKFNPNVKVELDISRAIKGSKVIVTVTGAHDSIIHPQDILPGSIICDVARPRDVAASVAKVRNDVLVIDGGIVKVPGSLDLNFDIGLPKGLVLACMAETMILALEEKLEDYTIGKDIPVEKVNEIMELAKKHGFELAGLRSFERALTDNMIDFIRQNAEKALEINNSADR